MQPRMLVDSEMRHLTVPQRFLAYANAYRSAATAMCQQMVSVEAERTWPNAAVVLMLAAHAVELFLKGLILNRDPGADIEHHRIDLLAKEYFARYPEQAFHWDVPFQVQYLGMSEAEIKAVERLTPMPSILYRYPTKNATEEWNAALGFTPQTALRLLQTLEADFGRIQSELT